MWRENMLSKHLVKKARKVKFKILEQSCNSSLIYSCNVSLFLKIQSFRKSTCVNGILKRRERVEDVT